MVVPSPVPMCRYRNEPKLQVGHRYGEAGVVEDPCYLVEFVKPWKAELHRVLPRATTTSSGSLRERP